MDGAGGTGHIVSMVILVACPASRIGLSQSDCISSSLPPMNIIGAGRVWPKERQVSVYSKRTLLLLLCYVLSWACAVGFNSWLMKIIESGSTVLSIRVL